MVRTRFLCQTIFFLYKCVPKNRKEKRSAEKFNYFLLFLSLSYEICLQLINKVNLKKHFYSSIRALCVLTTTAVPNVSICENTTVDPTNVLQKSPRLICLHVANTLSNLYLWEKSMKP